MKVATSSTTVFSPPPSSALSNKVLCQQSYKSREVYCGELVPLAFTKADKNLFGDPLLIIALARAEPIY